MSDILKTNLDVSNLTRRTELYAKAVGISMREAVEYQGGLLVRDLVAGANPKNLSKAQKKADADVRKVFAAGPNQAFPFDQRGGKKGITWLYASKGAVVGAHNADVKPTADLGEMKKDYAAERGGLRGNAFKELGRRGRQKTVLWNRIIVGKERFKRFTVSVRDKFGLQKAAWAYGWDVLKVKGRLPAWIRKHLTSGKAKGMLVNGLATPGKPHLTVISRATGVEHASSLRAVRAAIRKRIGSMQADLKHYLSGAKTKAGFYAARGTP